MRTASKFILAICIAAGLTGCYSMPSDSSLKVEIEVRSPNREILATGRTIGHESSQEGGGFLNVRAEGPYNVARDSMLANRAKRRFMIVRDVDRSTNLVWVSLIDLPERIVWCADWSPWTPGIPTIRDTSGLVAKSLDTIIASGAPIQPAPSPPDRKLEARYRVNHFTGKCVER